MAKLNKNLIIQLLTNEVERLRMRGALNETKIISLRQEYNELHAKTQEQTETNNNDYYSTESIAIRRAEQAETQLARARISFDELELLMTPCSITGKKIETIKLVRQITGAGLKEVKELVEHYDQAHQKQ